MEGEKLMCYVCQRLKSQSEFTVQLDIDTWICHSCKEKWSYDMKRDTMADYFTLRYMNLRMRRLIRKIEDEIEDL